MRERFTLRLAILVLLAALCTTASYGAGHCPVSHQPLPSAAERQFLPPVKLLGCFMTPAEIDTVRSAIGHDAQVTATDPKFDSGELNPDGSSDEPLVALSASLGRGQGLLPGSHPAGGGAGRRRGRSRRIMPLTRRETANGPVWVRAPYRPEDYTAPQDALRLFERWRRDDVESSEALLTLRDGPFGNYVEVGRQTREGKTWLVLLEASRELGVEVEARPAGFGEVVAVEPRRAYELAVARDRLRKLAVVS